MSHPTATIPDQTLREATYSATIWLGLREGYNGPEHSVAEVEAYCQQHVDKVGLCVTVTPTRFVYKGGSEVGVAVGLINYPRFPKTADEIYEQALKLASFLRRHFNQIRVTVVFPDDTVMLGNPE